MPKQAEGRWGVGRAVGLYGMGRHKQQFLLKK
jgi:hypothetical protein